jgi:glycosyltransferase involved in cell wall biosynthesis
VLLTVSGTIEPDVGRRVNDDQRPRPDYLEMARHMDADVVDVAEARRRAGRVGRLIERVAGTGALLAWVCFRARRGYEAVFTDGEQVGLPFAALCRLTMRPPVGHVMIVHIMSVAKKSWLYRVLRLGRYIDTMIVYSSAQLRYLTNVLGFPANRVVLTPFTVDTAFFSPGRVQPAETETAMICSAGLEFRDYPTLIEAARGLDARVVIAAASPWSKRPDETAGVTPPPNVETCRLGSVELRRLYGDARLVVMPLYDVAFQAGVTTILEAMAMGRAVVCTRTQGQTDVIMDGITGVYVPPRDSERLRSAIEALLDAPDRAIQIGAAARRFVVEQCDVEVYARRLAAVVDGVIDRHDRSLRSR